VEIDDVLSASAEMSHTKLANFCGDELLSDRLGALQYFQVHRRLFPKHLHNVFMVSEFCNYKCCISGNAKASGGGVVHSLFWAELTTF